MLIIKGNWIYTFLSTIDQIMKGSDRNQLQLHLNLFETYFNIFRWYKHDVFCETAASSWHMMASVWSCDSADTWCWTVPLTQTLQLSWRKVWLQIVGTVELHSWPETCDPAPSINALPDRSPRVEAPLPPVCSESLLSCFGGRELALRHTVTYSGYKGSTFLLIFIIAEL